MALDMGLYIDVLTDRQLEILQKAITQETEERETLYHEKLVEEYTDKLDDLADEIVEKGMAICYKGDPIDIRKFSVNWRDA